MMVSTTTTITTCHNPITTTTTTTSRTITLSQTSSMIVLPSILSHLFDMEYIWSSTPPRCCSSCCCHHHNCTNSDSDKKKLDDMIAVVNNDSDDNNHRYGDNAICIPVPMTSNPLVNTKSALENDVDNENNTSTLQLTTHTIGQVAFTSPVQHPINEPNANIIKILDDLPISSANSFDGKDDTIIGRDIHSTTKSYRTNDDNDVQQPRSKIGTKQLHDFRPFTIRRRTVGRQRRCLENSVVASTENTHNIPHDDSSNRKLNKQHLFPPRRLVLSTTTSTKKNGRRLRYRLQMGRKDTVFVDDCNDIYIASEQLESETIHNGTIPLRLEHIDCNDIRNEEQIFISKLRQELALIDQLLRKMSGCCTQTSTPSTIRTKQQYESIKLLLQQISNEIINIGNVHDFITGKDETKPVQQDDGSTLRCRTDTETDTSISASSTFTRSSSSCNSDIVVTTSDLSMRSHSSLSGEETKQEQQTLPINFYMRKQDLPSSTNTTTLIDHQEFIHITSPAVLGSVLEQLVQYGHQLVNICTDHLSRTSSESTCVKFQPTRETQRLLTQHSKGLPVDPISVYSWIGTKNTLITTTGLVSAPAVDDTGNDWPITKVQTIIPNTTTKELIEFLFDSSNVPSYNPISKGRDDILIWKNHDDNSNGNKTPTCNDCISGTVKIVRGMVQPKLLPQVIETLSLMYVTTIPRNHDRCVDDNDNEENNHQSYMIVSRSISEDETWDASPTAKAGSKDTNNIIRSEVLFGVYVVRPLPSNSNRDCCELTAIAHIVTSNPNIPEVIVKRMIPPTSTNMVREIQRIFSKKR